MEPQFVSSQCTQFSMHMCELAPCPLASLSCRGGRPVPPNVVQQAFPNHRGPHDSGRDRRLDIASLTPRHILETASGDIERLVYRHIRVLVSAVEFVALASRRSSCRAERRLVIDDHVLTRQRQFDSNVKSPAVLPVPVRHLQQYPASDDARIERFEPCHARPDLLLERRHSSAEFIPWFIFAHEGPRHDPLVNLDVRSLTSSQAATPVLDIQPSACENLRSDREFLPIVAGRTFLPGHWPI